MKPAPFGAALAAAACLLVLTGCASPTADQAEPSTAGPSSSANPDAQPASSSPAATTTPPAPSTEAPQPPGDVVIGLTVDGSPVEAPFLQEGRCEDQGAGGVVLSAGSEGDTQNSLSLSIAGSSVLMGAVTVDGTGYFIGGSTVSQQGTNYEISATAMRDGTSISELVITADCGS